MNKQTIRKITAIIGICLLILVVGHSHLIIQALPFILLGVFWLSLNAVLRHGNEDQI